MGQRPRIRRALVVDRPISYCTTVVAIVWPSCFEEVGMELMGKRALVTGASRGIGRAIALAYAAEGARLGLLARDGGRLQEVAEAVVAAGGEAQIRVADLGVEEQLRSAVSGLVDDWGGIDILVNNAGIQGPIGLLQENDPGLWQQTVQVNLVGSFLCMQQVLPAMLEQGSGKIICLSGGGAVSSRPCFSAYAASKAGVVRMMECVSAEVADSGIEVNAIAPGAVNTDMHRQILDAGERAGAVERGGAIDREKSGGEPPEKAAALAVFLASERSNGLTGKLISAVYDPWEELDIPKLMESDIYTMRRLND